MNDRPHRARSFLAGTLLIGLSLFLGFQRQAALAPGESFLAPLPCPSPVVEKPFYREYFVSDAKTRLVHSATLVQRTDGVLQAFWFGGSREGHRDVKIFTAAFNAQADSWSRDVALIDRQQARSGGRRTVKKLGNPVAAVDRDGRLWLFLVSVSLGGWSGSSINLTMSDDQGRTWSPPQPLITSPFFNLSTLVKGPPVPFADGSLGLPAYHEFLAKFSEFLRVDETGRVIGKSRMSAGRKAIQPVVFARDENSALALMRNTDSALPRRAWAGRTSDAGRTWSGPERTEILNRDSALAGVSTREGILIAANFSEQDRSGLSLLLSRDQGRTWALVHHVEPHRSPLAPDHFTATVTRGLEQGALPLERIAQAATETQCEPGRPRCDFRFDYPWLLRDDSGVYHLLYTWNRALIRHVTFNESWLASRPEQPLEALATGGGRP